MKFGLPDTTIENIQKVFEANAKVDEVIVFGSRAKGNYKEGSDIDLAVKGRNISFNDILKLHGQLDDLNLPYKIDLLDYATIKEPALVEHIDRVGIIFYQRLKQTDFGYVASNWNFITASQYCLKVTDGTHDSPKEQKTGKYLITSRHIKERNIDFENAYKISEDDFNKINLRSKVDQWDVIISMIGEYCGFSYVERNDDIDYAVKNVGLFKTGNETKSFWLYYFLNSKIGKSILEASKSGTSQPYITLNALRELPVLISKSETETNEILNILRSLDDKIDLLQRQNKTLEQLAETLFRQWFVEEADESWELKKISDVADINKRSIDKNYLYSEIEYLDTGSITEGNILGFQTYNLKDAPSRAQRIAEENDIVYSLVRPIQRHYGLLHNLKPNTIVSTGFCVVSCRDVHPYFIYLMLTNKETVEYFDAIAEGSTSAYPSLKPSDISNFEFLLPPKEKLKLFSLYTDNGWNKIKSNTIQIKQLTQLRDALLPKLMSGEVRVNT